MFLKSLPTGACLVFWHHTDQQVHSLMLPGHLFHHCFIQHVFSHVCHLSGPLQGSGSGGQQDRPNPCNRNWTHRDASCTWTHSPWFLRPLAQAEHRMVSSAVLKHSGLLLLFNRGNWGSLHHWTWIFCVLPCLPAIEVDAALSVLAQGGLGSVPC